MFVIKQYGLHILLTLMFVK